MKKNKKFYLLYIFIVILLIDGNVFSQDNSERIVRLEVKVEEGFKAVNQRIDMGFNAINQRIDDFREDMQRQISDLKTFIMWGFGIVFTFILFLIGFVFWDRRNFIKSFISKLKQALTDIKEIKKEQKRFKDALIIQAEKDPMWIPFASSLGMKLEAI